MLSPLRHSVLGKVMGLILLSLLLCIPLVKIDWLTSQRGRSQFEASSELASTYVGPQTLVGPIWVVPYVERWMEPQRDAAGKIVGERERAKSMLHLVFPDTLHVEGNMAPEECYRGIFRILFYRLNASLEGAFAAFDPASVPSSESGSTLSFRPPTS